MGCVIMVDNNVLFYELNDSRILGISTYQITKIPRYDVLGDNLNEVIKDVKQMFSHLLKEFYQITKGTDSAIELLLTTSKKENQSYKALLNMYLVVRITALNKNFTLSKLEEADHIITYNLLQSKFEVINTSYPFSCFSQDIMPAALAIRKKEDLKYLQNNMIPVAYTFDLLSDKPTEQDLLYNYLINTPDVAVSISLIPTSLYQNEHYFLENMMIRLGNLFNGISVPQYGFIRDGSVQDVLGLYEYYLNQETNGLFIMNIVVLGNFQNINNLASNLLMECSTPNENGKAPKFEIVELQSSNEIKSYPHLFPWIVEQKVSGIHRLQIVLDRYNQHLYRLPYIVSADEATQIFRLPVASNKITAGIDIIDTTKRNKTFTQGIINTADIILGRLTNIIDSKDANLGFNLKDLTKHMLVVGTPGSGKSTFLVGLMDRLWKNFKIPFLVIEPAKQEYRALIDSIECLQVFSPGKNSVAPYIINPFIPPKGVTLEVYKSIVKAAFSVAFEMWTPLDQLFDETLNICYSDCGWLDDTTIEDGKRIFTLPEFIETYRSVVNAKGYTGEYKKQVETAGVMRLQGLLEQNMNIFDNQNTVSIEDILTKPTVIELSNVKDIKQKSFIIAFLLNNIYAYVEANLRNDGMLKNVILLEEAHVLLSADTQAVQSESASSNQQAVRLLSGMLAEIRSRGVGIVIADQSSRKVSQDVIANTNIKVVFRLVEQSDKTIIKNSVNMSDLQFERMSKLKTGEALVYFDKLDEAEEIKLDDYRLNHNITTDLTDQELKSRMHYWDTHQKLLIPYEECKYIEKCSNTCNFTVRAKARAISDRIYRKYFESIKNLTDFQKAYYKINTYILKETEELFGKDTFKEILSCTKVMLLRKCRFYSSCKITRKMCLATIKNNEQKH